MDHRTDYFAYTSCLKMSTGSYIIAYRQNGFCKLDKAIIDFREFGKTIYGS